MKIELKKSNLADLKNETLVVFATKSVEKKTNSKAAKKEKANKHEAKAHVAHLPKAAEERLAETFLEAFSGNANESMFFREFGTAGIRHLLIVGLGDSKNICHETLRQAGAAALSSLKGQKCASAAIAFDTIPGGPVPAENAIQALCEGLALANYSFDEFKEKKPSDFAMQTLTLLTNSKSKSIEHGLEAASILAESVCFARWLGDRPGNLMNPTILAEETGRAAKGTKLKVTVWDKARIKQEKMNSFLSVSLGSSQDPKFIMLEYKGAAASKKPACFVGKGLTFDSGGISIKPSAGMEEMKYDMGGGAAVIAAMLAIAKLKLKVNAIAFVPATENMPGPSANKPGDIVIARNGKSIEINNTDAEGRLILADALVYASEQKPAFIVDAATLTGAMVMALGNLHTGLFTRNDKLNEKIMKAADESGEWIWRMPLTDMHVRDMKGTYADLSNTSSAKGAGSATAAGFLEQFVDKEIPWAHLDVAGTAWNTGDRLNYCPKKGATGVMVRTFVQLAKLA